MGALADPHADPQGNRLIEGLPLGEARALRSLLEVVCLEQRTVLFRPGEPVGDLHFPLDAVASMRILMEDGALAQAAIVGNEGVVGLPVFLGDGLGWSEAIVQVSGRALRMRADVFLRQQRRLPALDERLRRYTQALIHQLVQCAACNRLHRIRKRVARWLLMTQDRAARDEFELTHEFLSELLGVRRASVSVTLGALQRDALILGSRGCIEVLDRAGLEAAACECYASIQAVYDRLVGPLDVGEREGRVHKRAVSRAARCR